MTDAVASNDNYGKSKWDWISKVVMSQNGIKNIEAVLIKDSAVMGMLLNYVVNFNNESITLFASGNYYLFCRIGL